MLPQFERIVTAAEADKGHITIPQEAARLFKCTFKNIARERDAKRDRHTGLKTFHSARGPIRLNLVLRNPPRNELRLYFNQKEGLTAKAGQILEVLFRKGRAEIRVRDGGLKEKGPRLKDKARNRADSDDDEINSALYTQPKMRTQKARRVWARSGTVAMRCLECAGYRCQAGYKSFTSARTGKSYLEIHHLILLSLQKRFLKNLDVLENVFALSPFAHRAIHFGDTKMVRTIIDKLLRVRPGLLDAFGITREMVYEIYGCGARR